jgi:hypothetical protein
MSKEADVSMDQPQVGDYYRRQLEELAAGFYPEGIYTLAAGSFALQGVSILSSGTAAVGTYNLLFNRHAPDHDRNKKAEVIDAAAAPITELGEVVGADQLHLCVSGEIAFENFGSCDRSVTYQVKTEQDFLDLANDVLPIGLDNPALSEDDVETILSALPTEAESPSNIRSEEYHSMLTDQLDEATASVLAQTPDTPPEGFLNVMTDGSSQAVGTIILLALATGVGARRLNKRVKRALSERTARLRNLVRTNRSYASVEPGWLQRARFGDDPGSSIQPLADAGLNEKEVKVIKDTVSALDADSDEWPYLLGGRKAQSDMVDRVLDTLGAEEEIKEFVSRRR